MNTVPTAERAPTGVAESSDVLVVTPEQAQKVQDVAADIQKRLKDANLKQ